MCAEESYHSVLKTIIFRKTYLQSGLWLTAGNLAVRAFLVVNI